MAPTGAAAAESMPQLEDDAHGGQTYFADVAGRAAAVHQLLEIPLQMCPTELTPLDHQTAIDRPTVTTHNAFDPFAQQRGQAYGAAAGMNDKARHGPGGRRPQPTALAGLFPAGLINVLAQGVPHCLPRRGMALRRAHAHLLFEGDHT